MRLLGSLGWLLGCCYAVARVPRMVATAVARVHSVVAKVLLCVSRVHSVVAKVLLCGC